MFSTFGQLNKHKKAVHVLKSVKCDQCNYRAKRMSVLKRHIKTVHDVGDDYFKCDLCDYQGRKHHLKIHKESVHENNKNWFCKACPYSTYRKADFQQHMRIHTGEKPYHCKTCQKYFSHRANAKAHCKCKNAKINKRIKNVNCLILLEAKSNSNYRNKFFISLRKY